MAAFLELIFSMALGEHAEKRAWVTAVTAVFLGVGLVGAAGVAGYIPIDLEPLRSQLGAFGRQVVHWSTLVVMAVVWLIFLMALGLYFRLSDSSVGKPD